VASSGKGGDTRRALGAEGEARAERFLAARGWRILERNARAAGVELDLVAERAGTLAFVEVKTRRTGRLGAPEEAVDARKRARLVRGAAAWLRARRGRPQRVRFDVIVCEADACGGWRLRHLEAAFDAGD
jgi:putative endonuclease